MLKTKAPDIIPRLKEKMMTRSDPITQSIINANKESGSP